jgi:hypothetical protein
VYPEDPGGLRRMAEFTSGAARDEKVGRKRVPIVPSRRGESFYCLAPWELGLVPSRGRPSLPPPSGEEFSLSSCSSLCVGSLGGLSLRLAAYGTVFYPPLVPPLTLQLPSPPAQRAVQRGGTSAMEEFDMEGLGQVPPQEIDMLQSMQVRQERKSPGPYTHACSLNPRARRVASEFSSRKKVPCR